MRSYFTDLTRVFNGALHDFGAQNGVAVALENYDYAPSADAPYLAGTMLLADTQQADLNWTERRDGIYQVDINVPSHTGSTTLNALADTLNTAFKVGSNLVLNDICAEVLSVSLGPLIVQNGWAMRPLSINFVAFTERI